MTIFNENELSKNVSDSLKKKGIKNTTDNLDDLVGQNAIIDASNFNEISDDVAYMNKLKELCDRVKDKYDQLAIYIPVSKWYRVGNDKLQNSKTPVGCMCRYIKRSPASFKKEFAGVVFIFYNESKENFALYVNEYQTSEYQTVINLLDVLTTPHKTNYLTGSDTEKKNPVKDVVDDKKEEKEELDNKKQELVDAITAAAEDSESEEEAWDRLNDDEYVKQLLVELEEEDDGRPKFNNARTSRMLKVNDEFLAKKLNGKTVKDIIEGMDKIEEIPPQHLKVSSINKEWEEVRFTNFENVYDINSDILSILESFANKSYPSVVLDVNVEDTSTNMDYVDTYTVNMEDGFGKRFTLVFDIPKFKNNRFMRLRGNEKVISGQLLLLPCIKTDEDTVQCVSNYNKMFLYRYGLQGRSYPTSDKLIKSLNKIEKDNHNIKVFFGDNSAICSKYELPADYIDLASQINRIETKTKIYYFDQDVYFEKFEAKKSNGIPYAINKIDSSICYYKDNNNLISYVIAVELSEMDENFDLIYKAAKPANRLNYSLASILNRKIPLVVVLGYSLGLSKVLERCSASFSTEFSKSAKYNHDKEGVIRFSDGYIKYEINYSTSMLLNGLSECPTEEYSIGDINKRTMWLDFLDKFGGRILADGLDNFADLFMDPITVDVCERCNIPSGYFDMLIYANNLLADNKYNRHTDINGNRYRSNELVAGYFYKAISKSYTDYKAQVKRGRNVGMTMKRSAVIDGIMSDPMSSDLSILNPLLEIEASNSVSFKGLSGMNSDRSYGLDKRTYDESMLNKLALSTGFSANVGINRQTTIDMDIEGARGYIKNSNPDDMSVTKTFSMTEAITPFGSTRDDPFRTAMTFIQTSKHSMRTAKSMPLLITNGADEAMAYISSDTFSYKAKEDGQVVEFVEDEYMVISYKNPIPIEDGTEYTNELINLKREVQKNSDGGFYITLKLDTDLKQESKFKKGDIIAYDRSSYSNKNGEDDNLAYNVGVLAKVAILNTDEGFEDSTSVSYWLSDAMATDVVVNKEKSVSKDTNIYHIVKVGQEIQEGDPLMIFQNSFDEKDANMLLKNITDPDYVSDLGRIKLKSKYTGIIQDIKIYRTCEFDDMSDSLKKIVKEYENNINKRRKVYKNYNIPGENLLDPTYKMDATGIMKNNPDGVTFIFYIKYNDKLSVGDKVVAQSANKGVIKNIFSEGYEPFSEYRPNEPIHALFAARSFNARMVTSVWTSGAINKCMIELDRQVKEIMGIDWEPIENME